MADRFTTTPPAAGSSAAHTIRFPTQQSQQHQHHHQQPQPQPGMQVEQQQRQQPSLFQPATPRKRRRSEENAAFYYYATAAHSSPATPAPFPTSNSYHNDGTLLKDLLSPARISSHSLSSSSSASSFSAASSSYSTYDGLIVPPMAKRPHSLHRTWTAPLNAFGGTPAAPPAPPVVVVESTTESSTMRSPFSAPASTRTSWSAQQHAAPSLEALFSAAHRSAPEAGATKTSENEGTGMHDDAEMNTDESSASTSSQSALQSPPPRLLSPASVSPASSYQQPRPSTAFSSPSSALSTPWQRRFADSTSPLATSASFPFTRRATLGHSSTAPSARNQPIFGVSAFSTRESSLPAPRTSMLGVPQPHIPQRRTSTSSLGHAPAFGTAFSRSMSAQNLLSASTAGLLLPPPPSPLSAAPQSAGPGVVGVVAGIGGSSSSGPAGAIAGGSPNTPGGSAGTAATYAPLRPSPLIQSHTLTGAIESPPTRSSNSSSGDSSNHQGIYRSGSSSTEMMMSHGSGDSAPSLSSHTGAMFHLGRAPKNRTAAPENGGGTAIDVEGEGVGDQSLAGPSRLPYASQQGGQMANPPFAHTAPSHSAVQSGKRRHGPPASGGAFTSSAGLRDDASRRSGRDGGERWRTSALVDSDDSDDDQMADVSSSSLSDVHSHAQSGSGGGHGRSATASPGGTMKWPSHSKSKSASSVSSSPSSSTPSSPVRSGRTRLRTMPLPSVGRGDVIRTEGESDDAEMLTAALSNIDTGLRASASVMESSSDMGDLTVTGRAGNNTVTTKSSTAMPRTDSSQIFGWPAETMAARGGQEVEGSRGTSTLTSPSPSTSSSSTSTTASGRSSIGDAAAAGLEGPEIMRSREGNASGRGTDATMERAFGNVSLRSPTSSTGVNTVLPRREPGTATGLSGRSTFTAGTGRGVDDGTGADGATPRSHPVTLPSTGDSSVQMAAAAPPALSASTIPSPPLRMSYHQHQAQPSLAQPSSPAPRPSSPLVMAMPRPLHHLAFGSGLGVAVAVGPGASGTSGQSSLAPTPVSSPAKWY
ncbi:hypothetical protein A4X09_0g2023 [Tilletia walkeri]|uniref:Uncharacterized protein n=1 Tax=Tilletia walkeri TaxID=117179 RepID=A0A8X7NCA5_9BASI|nr:hypothetical protein A4X09_0g2023 [Tilletia walkeri]